MDNEFINMIKHFQNWNPFMEDDFERRIQKVEDKYPNNCICSCHIKENIPIQKSYGCIRCGNNRVHMNMLLKERQEERKAKAGQWNWRDKN